MLKNLRAACFINSRFNLCHLSSVVINIPKSFSNFSVSHSSNFTVTSLLLLTWCVCDLLIFFSPILIPRSTPSNQFAIVYSCIRSLRFLLISKPLHPTLSSLLSSKTIPKMYSSTIIFLVKI